jgi:uncharacterized protein YbjQ (UPF0145 family)
MIELIILLSLLLTGLIVGKVNESRHYNSIQEREREFLTTPAVTLANTYPLERPVARTAVSIGSVVVSVDYFKRFLFGFRNIFGGEVKSYSSLLDRGRREAMLRMKEAHPDADAFINCRLETSSVTKGQKDRVSCSEVIAYGTAIYYGPATSAGVDNEIIERVDQPVEQGDDLKQAEADVSAGG